MTIVPVVICFILLLLRIFLPYIWKNSGSMKYYLNLTLINLLYYLLPNISSIIFSIFSCVNIDPLNELPLHSPRLYLQEDLSKTCESLQYFQFKKMAYLMIFVFPVGVPMAFYFALRYTKQNFNRKKIPSKFSMVCRPSMSMIDSEELFDSMKVLHDGYKNEFWY